MKPSQNRPNPGGRFHKPVITKLCKSAAWAGPLRTCSVAATHGCTSDAWTKPLSRCPDRSIVSLSAARAGNTVSNFLSAHRTPSATQHLLLAPSFCFLDAFFLADALVDWLCRVIDGCIYLRIFTWFFLTRSQCPINFSSRHHLARW